MARVTGLVIPAVRSQRLRNPRCQALAEEEAGHGQQKGRTEHEAVVLEDLPAKEQKRRHSVLSNKRINQHQKNQASI